MAPIKRFWITLITFFFPLLGTAIGQESSNAIPITTPFSRITTHLDAGAVLQWRLPALSGSVLSFRVTVLSGDLDPRFRLIEESGGEVLFSDDVAYPDDLGVLVEAYTIPKSAVYRIEIHGGMTRGDFQLEILRGYSRWLDVNLLSATEAWKTETPNQIVPGLDRLTLLTSAAAPLVDTHLVDRTLRERLYIHAEVAAIVTSVTSNDWQVSLTARVSDEGHYALSVNHLGEWRFTLRREDDIEILSNWQRHPFLDPDERKFSLAILANGPVYELFLNEQFIASITNQRLPFVGGAGIQVGDWGGFPQINNRVDFAQFAITVPESSMTDITNFVFTPASRAGILQSLRRAALLPPSGGEMFHFIPEAHWYAVGAGVEHFDLGNPLSIAGEYVLSSVVSWETSSELAGCGLVLGDYERRNYLLAYADSGGFGLTEREGEIFTNHSFSDQAEKVGEGIHLLLLRLEGSTIFYLNGHFAGKRDISDDATGLESEPVAFAVINHWETANTCHYRDTWVWGWEEN